MPKYVVYARRIPVSLSHNLAYLALKQIEEASIDHRNSTVKLQTTRNGATVDVDAPLSYAEKTPEEIRMYLETNFLLIDDIVSEQNGWKFLERAR